MAIDGTPTNAGLKPGARVIVDAGTYRTGRTPSSHLHLDWPTRGTVRVVYEQSHQGARIQRDPTVVLVYIDDADLPNPHAPGSVMVPPASLDIIEED